VILQARLDWNYKKMSTLRQDPQTRLLECQTSWERGIYRISFPNQKIRKLDENSPDSKTMVYQICNPDNEIKSMGAYIPITVSPRRHYDDQLSCDIISNKGKYGAYTARLATGMFFFMKFLYPKFLQSDYIVPIPAQNSNTVTGPISIVNHLVEYVKNDSTYKILPLSPLEKRFNQKMKSMHRQARREFYEKNPDAFVVKNNVDLKGKIILLVDDVLTSGSTMRFCKNKLEKAGAIVNSITAAVTA